MSVRIFIKEDVILHVKNSIFDALHKSIMSIIEENNITLSASVSSMLNNMDQDVFGRGLVSTDITEFIETKSDLKIFADLLKQAIEREQASEYPFIPDAEKILLAFYNSVLKYGESLKH